MTWEMKRHVAAGRFSAQGMCPACGADLTVHLLNRHKYAVYRCSRKGCQFEKKGVPRSSDPYSGPGKGPKG